MNIKYWSQSKDLLSWQIDFSQKYLEQRKSRSLLVAAPGTGRTNAALYTAGLLWEQDFHNLLIVITDTLSPSMQWKQVATKFGFNLSNSINDYKENIHNGISITAQSTSANDNFHKLLDLAKNLSSFCIIDKNYTHAKPINNIVDELLEVNNNNRSLFISSFTPLAQDTFDDKFHFNTEYIFQDSIIRLPETKIEISHFSPSFSILQKLIGKSVQIDDLNWREFEKLVSELLVKDGYEVELMRGTKDGGVDVVAVKDMGAAGFFKTLWQAKKKLLKNKVGLSVIRELADTRNEFKASKGIIITSTYLTKDALARIQRDKYLLGKVDRDDLNQWIQKILFRGNS